MLEAAPQGSETILVVDDDDILHDLAKEQLENLGYSVLTANNGAQALEILAAEANIQLLMTDVVMPGMSGFELAKQTKKDFPQLKILMVSGYSQQVVIDEGMPEFIDKILSKPYSYIALAQKVRYLLDKT